MAKDLLLEIGLEEMPAHIVTKSMKQLEEKLTKFLNESRLEFATIEGFSTPRRLAVRVKGISEKQADTSEEIKGPAKKIALDENGNWSKAAIGFVKGKGLDVDDITFKEIKGVEYVYVAKFEEGKSAEEILKELPSVITSLTFPVSMRWADYDFEYIRPIHWIVALLENEIIPFQVLDIETGRVSRGHRLIEGTPTIDNPSVYEEELAKFHVIVNPALRKEIIIKQIREIEQKNNWKVEIDEELLEEVNNLVEYPTAFAGKFDEKYLEVPEEVLVTSMKAHQRFFDVRKSEGNLSAHFISVRNGTGEYLENVVSGNEKVLVARLEDSEFFWNEDLKLKISDLTKKLEKVTFHEKIGTLSEHMKRTKVIAKILAKTIGLTETEKTDLVRAAEIYKFDLVTNMVGEFPELQGVMGEKYAILQGENAQVGQAIREHYLPIAADGELPQSNVGAILAVAEKLESVYSFFSVGLIPSGSNDPYALRRFTQGMVRIIESFNWHFDFHRLQEAIFTAINEDTSEYKLEYTAENEALEFIKARVRQLLTTQIKRHDILDAAINGTNADITEIFEVARVLDTHKDHKPFRPAMENLTRIINLAKKAEVAVEVNVDLFENEYERALHVHFEEIKDIFSSASSIEEKFRALVHFAPAIIDYFDHTMVMTEDEKIRNNRLSELQEIATLITSFAAVDELIVK